MASALCICLIGPVTFSLMGFQGHGSGRLVLSLAGPGREPCTQSGNVLSRGMGTALGHSKYVPLLASVALLKGIGTMILMPGLL